MIDKVSYTPSFLSQTQSTNGRSSRKELDNGEGLSQAAGSNGQDIVDISTIRPVPANQSGYKVSDRLEGEGERDTVNGEEKLTTDEKVEIEGQKRRDREVRKHEEAHMAAAGPYVRGGPSYEYQVGPDARRYVTDGEVSIDTSPVSNDPDATIRKAETIRRAANAPAEPSSQDRQVESQASRMEADARAEKVKEAREEYGEGEATSNTGRDESAKIEVPGGTSINDGPAARAGGHAYARDTSEPWGTLDVIT